jgi:hypothetical protein
MRFEAFLTRRSANATTSVFSVYKNFELYQEVALSSPFSTTSLVHSLKQTTPLVATHMGRFWKNGSMFAKVTLQNFGGELDEDVGQACAFDVHENLEQLSGLKQEDSEHVERGTAGQVREKRRAPLRVGCHGIDRKDHDIWLSSGASTSWIHYDFSHNFYLEVHGERRFYLWSMTGVYAGHTMAGPEAGVYAGCLAYDDWS